MIFSHHYQHVLKNTVLVLKVKQLLFVEKLGSPSNRNYLVLVSLTRFDACKKCVFSEAIKLKNIT